MPMGKRKEKQRSSWLETTHLQAPWRPLNSPAARGLTDNRRTGRPRLSPREFTSIAYIAEDQNLPGWMTLDKL
jgi:hypothetical protein